MIPLAIRGAVGYLHTVCTYRYFWLSLVKGDLRRRYRRSMLGVGWSLLNPLLMTTTLCLVYQQVFNLPFAEFAPFLLTGLAFWAFFSGAVLEGCSCFFVAEAYIRQAPAPMAIYSLRTVLSLGVHFTIALLMVLVLSTCLGGTLLLPDPARLVPTLVLLFFLFWSLATLMAFVTVYFPDLRHVAECGLQILFFLTPIIYPPRVLADKGWSAVLQYNPLATLVQLLRDALVPGPGLGGAGVELSQVQMLVLGGWTALVVVLAVFVVARFERKVIFQL